ncbi:MAG: AfsR/SARP family transcriptional regulator [Caldilineaceae bacterium]
MSMPPVPATAPLRLSVLGGFHLTIQEITCTHFYSDKVRALLCYLALAGDQSVRRETLTDLLWPGYAPLSARASLRRALTELRKTLVPYPLLTTTYHTVQLVNTPPLLWCDAQAFCALAVGCADHQPTLLLACPVCAACRQQALALYLGEFLQGFTHLDSAPFHAWRQAQATRFAQVATVLRQLHLENNLSCEALV